MTARRVRVGLSFIVVFHSGRPTRSTNGIVFELSPSMRDRRGQTSLQMVRWVFQQGNHLVTCAVDRDPNGSSYAVSVECNGQSDNAIVEICDSGVVALQRHADIATALRGHGWTLVAYTGSRTTPRRMRPLVGRSHAA